MAIPFTRQILSNGLHVLVHEDRTTPLAACTIVYRVGSRDEDPACTGLAHLMEHFMFSGSDHAPDFDLALQKVGGLIMTGPTGTNVNDVAVALLRR